MTEMDRQTAAGKALLGKMWDAQIDALIEGGAAENPTFVMPLRWDQMPEHLKGRAAGAAVPLIGAFNQLIRVLSDQAKREVN